MYTYIHIYMYVYIYIYIYIYAERDSMPPLVCVSMCACVSVHTCILRGWIERLLTGMHAHAHIHSIAVWLSIVLLAKAHTCYSVWYLVAPPLTCIYMSALWEFTMCGESAPAKVNTEAPASVQES